jgi:hypothetical protein
VEGTVLHRVVRENLSTLLLECAEAGGLPRFVERDFERYLACGVLAHGFTRVVCATCREERLVAFSCKGRGVCPSCNARRAHDTAIHLTRDVLPTAPYRQWTLSFPIQRRFLLARDSALLSQVLGLFVRALFAFQRRTARRLAERAHQISDITQSVKDIADSSNMLSLNAAIEAVRSGEAGKGFALLAREMRSLADQSIKATERVREILDDVGAAIRQATAISDRGTQQIQTGLDQLARSGESVQALVAMVSESSQSARVIAAAVRQQNAGIVQIVRSIADQRALAERTSEGLTLTQTHADALQALTRQVSELLKSYRI